MVVTRRQASLAARNSLTREQRPSSSNSVEEEQRFSPEIEDEDDLEETQAIDTDEQDIIGPTTSLDVFDQALHTAYQRGHQLTENSLEEKAAQSESVTDISNADTASERPTPSVSSLSKTSRRKPSVWLDHLISPSPSPSPPQSPAPSVSQPFEGSSQPLKPENGTQECESTAAVLSDPAKTLLDIDDSGEEDSEEDTRYSSLTPMPCGRTPGRGLAAANEITDLSSAIAVFENIRKSAYFGNLAKDQSEVLDKFIKEAVECFQHTAGSCDLRRTPEDRNRKDSFNSVRTADTEGTFVTPANSTRRRRQSQYTTPVITRSKATPSLSGGTVKSVYSVSYYSMKPYLHEKDLFAYLAVSYQDAVIVPSHALNEDLSSSLNPTTCRFPNNDSRDLCVIFMYNSDSLKIGVWKDKLLTIVTSEQMDSEKRMTMKQACRLVTGCAPTVRMAVVKRSRRFPDDRDRKVIYKLLELLGDQACPAFRTHRREYIRNGIFKKLADHKELADEMYLKYESILVPNVTMSEDAVISDFVSEQDIFAYFAVKYPYATIIPSYILETEDLRESISRKTCHFPNTSTQKLYIVLADVDGSIQIGVCRATTRTLTIFGRMSDDHIMAHRMKTALFVLGEKKVAVKHVPLPDAEKQRNKWEIFFAIRHIENKNHLPRPAKNTRWELSFIELFHSVLNDNIEGKENAVKTYTYGKESLAVAPEEGENEQILQDFVSETQDLNLSKCPLEDSVLVNLMEVFKNDENDGHREQALEAINDVMGDDLVSAHENIYFCDQTQVAELAPAPPSEEAKPCWKTLAKEQERAKAEVVLEVKEAKKASLAIAEPSTPSIFLRQGEAASTSITHPSSCVEAVSFNAPEAPKAEKVQEKPSLPTKNNEEVAISRKRTLRSAHKASPKPIVQAISEETHVAPSEEKHEDRRNPEVQDDVEESANKESNEPADEISKAAETVTPINSLVIEQVEEDRSPSETNNKDIMTGKKRSTSSCPAPEEGTAALDSPKRPKAEPIMEESHEAATGEEAENPVTPMLPCVLPAKKVEEVEVPLTSPKPSVQPKSVESAAAPSEEKPEDCRASRRNPEVEGEVRETANNEERDTVCSPSNTICETTEAEDHPSSSQEQPKPSRSRKRSRKNTTTDDSDGMPAKRSRSDSLTHYLEKSLRSKLTETTSSQGNAEPYTVFNSHWSRKLKLIRTINLCEEDLPESKPHRKLNNFLQLGLVQKFDYLMIRQSIFGKGIFASEHIKADRYVVDFPCRAMSSSEFERMYDAVSVPRRKKIDKQRLNFDIPEKSIDYVFCALDVDDKKRIPTWNGKRIRFYGHLLNHSEKHPNVKPVVKHRVDEQGNRVAIVIFRSIRDIKKGEELLWDYVADGVSPHLAEKPWIKWCPCWSCEGKCWCDVCKGQELHLAVVY